MKPILSLPASIFNEMQYQESNIDRLLKARAEIDDQLRQHKRDVAILFTDVVGSTAYFERYGDTAGFSMMQRHADLASRTIEEYRGRVIKTIGDSVMAEFSESGSAVRASIELQRRVVLLNQTLPERDRLLLRIGVNAGIAFRHGNDVYGDAVNVAARVAKHTGPAQILVSRSVRDAILLEPDIRCTWAGKVEMHGKSEEKELFEILWTDRASYSELRSAATAAMARGDLKSPGLELSDLLQPERTPTPVPAPEPPKPGRRRPRGTGQTTRKKRTSSTVAERFDVLSELGRGGMAVVYKALDRETGETIALKKLKPAIADSPGVLERFKNELRLARKITHKNICRIYDLNREGDTLSISMEYVEGESLREILSRLGAFNVKKAVQITLQICAGLREAHLNGIVHRDLKPENVMIDRAGDVKVMDFGIARSLSQNTPHSSAGALTGTPAYMAPEQVQGKDVDGRTDIYAVGLILYELVTGTPVFTGDSTVVVALKHVHETPISPRELGVSIPPDVEQTILKCLKKNPEERFQSVMELEQALSGAVLTPVLPVLPVAGSFLTTAAPPKPLQPSSESNNPNKDLPAATASSVAFGLRRSDYFLGAAALGGIVVFLLLFGRSFPVANLRLQLDRDQAESWALKYLLGLNHGAPVEVDPYMVYINSWAGDEAETGDVDLHPDPKFPTLRWKFTWRSKSPSNTSHPSGTVELDARGDLKSFTADARAGTTSPTPELKAEDYRAKAAQLAHDFLNFDATAAKLEQASTLIDGKTGQPYLRYRWIAGNQDEQGTPVATVELDPELKFLARTYKDYGPLPPNPERWTDKAGAGVYFAMLMLLLGPGTLRHSLHLRRAAIAGALLASGALLVMKPWSLLSVVDVPVIVQEILVALFFFIFAFGIWATCEYTILRRWPEKLDTFTRPFDRGWLQPDAASSILRGAGIGLALLLVYTPLVRLLSVANVGRVSTWLLSWPLNTSSPALFFFLGVVTLAFLISMGPIGVLMAMGRKWSSGLLVPAVALLWAVLIRHPIEATRANTAGAQMILTFVAGVGLAGCFYTTDLLGTIVATVIFDGTVGTYWLMTVNSDLSIVSYIIVFFLLFSVPALAALSLYIHRKRSPLAKPQLQAT